MVSGLGVSKTSSDDLELLVAYCKNRFGLKNNKNFKEVIVSACSDYSRIDCQFKAYSV